MRGRGRRLLELITLVWVLLGSAASLSAQETPALRDLIEAAETLYGVDSALIEAIMAQESGRWPWALNVNGVSLKPRSRDEAERILTRSGDNVDIGLMQVNYRHWGRLVGLSKRELLDPWINVAVGTQILRVKMSEEPGWPGVARYHSATPWRQLLYATSVSQLYAALRDSRLTPRTTEVHRSSPSPLPLPLRGGEDQGEGVNPLRVAVEGIVIFPDLGVRVALLSDPTLTNGVAREFRPGESIGGWTIAEILADRVVLRRGERSAEIRAR